MRQRQITVRGKGGKDRIVRIGHKAARSLDRYIRARSRHGQAWRPQLWLGVNNREPLTAAGVYQMITRRGRQCGVDAYPHRFRHHFSHTWLDRGGTEGDLIELNGWTSPQMLRRYDACVRSARAHRTYDRIFFTICGSKVPARSRGTSIPTGLVLSVSTVLGPGPVPDVPAARAWPAGSCFSLPRCP